MEKQKTTIQVSHEVWEIINKQKKVGENLNDVLIRLLKKVRSQEEILGPASHSLELPETTKLGEDD